MKWKRQGFLELIDILMVNSSANLAEYFGLYMTAGLF